MKFIVNSQIFEKYPGTIIGVIVARGIDNVGGDNSISDLLRSEERRIKAEFDPETLSQDPRINCWRKVYSSFGVKPKEAKSSVENLYKMVARGIEIRKINKLVDIYNYICLNHMMPVGGEDIDNIFGNLLLTFATNNEKPVQLLGDHEPEVPAEGEVFYKDDDSAVCRRWNWREADRTKLTEETKNAVLVIEGISPLSRVEVEAAVAELRDLVQKYCGGTVENFIIDQNNPEIEL
jgi:lysyl-tRNA synthetase class 2